MLMISDRHSTIRNYFSSLSTKVLSLAKDIVLRKIIKNGYPPSIYSSDMKPINLVCWRDNHKKQYSTLSDHFIRISYASQDQYALLAAESFRYALGDIPHLRRNTLLK